MLKPLFQMKRTFTLLISFTLILLSGNAYSQQNDSILTGKQFLPETKSISDNEFKPDFSYLLSHTTFRGTLQTQFINSLTSGVDYNKVEFGDEPHSNSTFNIKKAKLQVNAKITDKAEIVISGTLSSSASNTNILRNAYVAYYLSSYLNFRIGQFRPLAGIESTYSSDVVKSLTFSNQYYAFRSNGWTGPQIGAEISGKFDLNKLLVSYNLEAYNGNGKNIPDNDSGKNFLLRNVYYFPSFYSLNIGLNGGLGRTLDKDTYMAALDARLIIPLVPKWSLYMESQIGKGTNQNSYFKNPERDNYKFSDYTMQGWYILPNLRYEIGKPFLYSFEFSCRYEQWEPNQWTHNLRQTLTPALSMEFLRNYNLRLTMAVEMNRYNYNVPKTSAYNSDVFTTQLQARF